MIKNGILIALFLSLSSSCQVFSTGTSSFIYSTDNCYFTFSVNRSFEEAPQIELVKYLEYALPYIIGLDNSLKNSNIFHEILIYSFDSLYWKITIKAANEVIYDKQEKINLKSIFEHKIKEILKVKIVPVDSMLCYKVKVNTPYENDELEKSINDLWLNYLLQNNYVMQLDGDISFYFFWKTPVNKNQLLIEFGLFVSIEEAKETYKQLGFSDKDITIVPINVVCKDFHKLFY